MKRPVGALLRATLRPITRHPRTFLLGSALLGLGMGAAVSLFSVVDAVLLEGHNRRAPP